MATPTDDSTGDEKADSDRFTLADLKQVLTGRLQHESEVAYYVLLSVLDFYLTYVLITSSGGSVRHVEANPVAAWFLNHYGFVKGMLPFKLATVLLVCVVAQFVSLKRPRLGRIILWLGIAASLWVVVYSLRLLAASW